MQNTILFRLALLHLLPAFDALSLVGPASIFPGTGLEGKDGTEIVVFEHTDMGTGGLVLNRPTPVLLKDLSIPRFSGHFGSNALMLGCGIQKNGAGGGGGSGNIAIGDMAPWFWLHDIDGISGSFQLCGAGAGAGGALYMGGNLDEAIQRLEAEGINPLGHFKFFYKYRAWASGQLNKEIESGEWTKIGPQNPQRALKAYSMIGLIGRSED